MAAGYWIANFEVNDPQGYQEYAKLAGPAIGKFGGKLKCRGGNRQIKEGQGPAGNLVIVEFPNYQAAVDCYNSPEYQKALPLRVNASKPGGTLSILEGMD
jgi:uncharacterized protein (DUF1330 family)